MYRTNPTLERLIQQVQGEFEVKFGFTLSPELIMYIYGSQSLGVHKYMKDLQPVKMRGLLVFMPSDKRMSEHTIPKPDNNGDTIFNKE